jgi:hypothetical protein
MARRECFHCKQLIDEGEQHDCWTTTEAALTRHLADDLREAWERIRETAATFGEQRIYASHNSIMFARKACYFFVRPKRNRLEVCFFLGRPVKAPTIRKAMWASRVRMAHMVHVTHRDQVEAPLTDWLKEAYDVSDTLSGRGATSAHSVGVRAEDQPIEEDTVAQEASTCRASRSIYHHALPLSR